MNTLTHSHACACGIDYVDLHTAVHACACGIESRCPQPSCVQGGPPLRGTSPVQITGMAHVRTHHMATPLLPMRHPLESSLKRCHKRSPALDRDQRCCGEPRCDVTGRGTALVASRSQALQPAHQLTWDHTCMRGGGSGRACSTDTQHTRTGEVPWQVASRWFVPVGAAVAGGVTQGGSDACPSLGRRVCAVVVLCPAV